MNTAKKILRGDIFIVDFAGSHGSEQGGIRPALVVSNNTGNRHAPTAIVAPITSRHKPSLPVHLPLNGITALKKGSIVLLEQVRTVDKSRIGRYLGALGHVAMCLVDAALAVSLGIRRIELDGELPRLASKPEHGDPAFSMDGSKEPVTRTLCRRCRHMYEDAGYELRLLSNLADAKAICDYCHTRTGFEYEVTEW